MGEIMSSTAVQSHLTPEEYLALERKATIKSEYLNGQMYAMSGATRVHNLVCGNVFGELRNQLKESACEVYTNDMRVKVSSAGLYTYPDVLVVCDEPRFEDDSIDTLLNPPPFLKSSRRVPKPMTAGRNSDTTVSLTPCKNTPSSRKIVCASNTTSDKENSGS